MNKEHKCVSMRYCTCSQLADEPDDDCLIHGHGIPNRCQCGRFVKVKKYTEEDIKRILDSVDWNEYWREVREEVAIGVDAYREALRKSYSTANERFVD